MKKTTDQFTFDFFDFLVHGDSDRFLYREKKKKKRKKKLNLTTVYWFSFFKQFSRNSPKKILFFFS